MFENNVSVLLLLEQETGSIVDANATAARFYGYSIERLREMRIDQINTMPPDELAATRTAAIHLKQNRFIFSHRLASGELRTVEVHATPIELDGRVLLFSIVHDITEQYRTEQALYENEARLSAVFHGSPIGISVVRLPDSIFLDINETALQIFGYRRDEVLGRSSLELGLFIDPAQRDEGLRRIHQHGSLMRYPIDFRRKDGGAGVLEFSGRFIEYQGNRCVLGMWVDITERRKIDGQLHKLSLAVEQSPESIVITDINGKIEYVNLAFVQSTGYSANEVIGRNPRILQSGKTPRETYSDMWTTLTQGEPWKGEFCNRRKDGSEYIEFAIITPLHQEDGQITHFVAVKDDITEKKLLAQELNAHRHHLEKLVEERTAELTSARRLADEANQTKSAFLASMSHEIRTPMNGILGMAGILRREGVTPRQAERLDAIDRSARHLLSIINDILDISKIEAGKIELEDLPLNVVNLLDNVRSIIAARASERSIQLCIEAENFPRNLRGDPTRLQQAILNYASNALKFTERGKVTLRVCVLEDKDDSLLLRFEVQDTGVGIPADVLPRLFKTFEQADNSTTRKYGGTGLGLAITRCLAELMGGEAGVDSEAGVGSRFWFSALLKKGKEAHISMRATGADAESELRRHYAGSPILVVDDEPMNQEIARILLESAGLAVDTADDGKQALTLAREKRYTAIFMDMQMPNLSGLDATRQIRQLPDCRDTPIIAMTANAFAENKAQCIAAGMTEFLTKPFNAETMFDILLRSLNPGEGETLHR